MVALVNEAILAAEAWKPSHLSQARSRRARHDVVGLRGQLKRIQGILRVVKAAAAAVSTAANRVAAPFFGGKGAHVRVILDTAIAAEAGLYDPRHTLPSLVGTRAPCAAPFAMLHTTIRTAVLLSFAAPCSVGYSARSFTIVSSC